jgi:adenylate cyclase class 2
MKERTEELEVKFYLTQPALIDKRLKQLQAELAHPRVHEINLRFDTPDGQLTREKRVLRLRQDQNAVITYKGVSKPGEEVNIRAEYEITVSSFDMARRILEALGYVVSVSYEKYRTDYLLKGTKISMDEMPFGRFLEIEGESAAAIKEAADLLGLDWGARCTESYLQLFARVREFHTPKAKNLTFAEMGGHTYTASDFGLRAADELL